MDDHFPFSSVDPRRIFSSKCIMYLYVPDNELNICDNERSSSPLLNRGKKKRTNFKKIMRLKKGKRPSNDLINKILVHCLEKSNKMRKRRIVKSKKMKKISPKKLMIII